MPFGIRDRISSITKKYKEKQALKYKTKKELDAIYEEAKVKQMKKEVAKRAVEAAKETSKKRHLASPMGRVIGGLQTISKVAKEGDPHRNPFAEYRTGEKKKKKKKSKSKNKSRRKHELRTADNNSLSSNNMFYSNHSPMDNVTINEDPFEAEGKRWLDGM